MSNEMKPEELEVPEEKIELGGLEGKGDEDFVKNEDPEKNATKVVFDQEHNKAILEEFKEAMKPPVEGVKPRGNADVPHLDENTVPPTSEDGVSVEVEKTEEGTKINVSAAPKIDENGEFEDEVDIKKTERFLSRLEEYIADPSKLKFTEEETNDMLKYIGSSVGGRDMITSIVDMVNFDVKNILDGIEEEKQNPEKAKEVFDKDENGNPYPEDERPLNYANPNDRKIAIEKALEFRMSTEDAISAAKEVTSPEFINKVFTAKYPLYIEKGPAWVVEDIIRYVKGACMNKEIFDVLIKRINNEKAVVKALDTSNKQIFRYMHLTNGKPFTTTHFLISLVGSMKNQIAEIYNIPVEQVIINDKKQPLLSSLYVVLMYVFGKRFVKHHFRNISRHTFERKLFYQFIGDIQPDSNLPEDKRELLNAAWTEIITSCKFIAESALVQLNQKK